jgi:hypothetical protein|tara:strand:+ start:154 stop:732 length:579 start_codon:yes stop_codon:yes gene_type:complete
MDENTKLEMSKIVKQLMDEEGFEFGEAVKEAMRRMEKTKKANGGIMRKMLRAGDDPRDFEDEVQETDVDVIELMKDQGIPMGEQVKKKEEGIMQLAGEDPEDERDLEFLIEFKEFQDNNPGKTIDDFIEIKIGELIANRKAKEEELARITLAGGSFPDLSKDGEITQEDILIGRGVLPEPKRSGGIAGILGV